MEWVASKEFRDKLGLSVREFEMISWSLLCLGGRSGIGPESVVGKSFPVDFVNFMVARRVAVGDYESIRAFVRQSERLVQHILDEYDQAFSQVAARLGSSSGGWIIYEPIASFINKTAGALLKWDRGLVLKIKKNQPEVNLLRLCNTIYWRLPTADGLAVQVYLAELPAISAALQRLKL